MSQLKLVPNLKSAAIIFAVFGMIFLTIGCVIHIKGRGINEMVVQYDDECSQPNFPPFAEGVNNTCVLTFKWE